jgi:hypothetical protein
LPSMRASFVKRDEVMNTHGNSHKPGPALLLMFCRLIVCIRPMMSLGFEDGVIRDFAIRMRELRKQKGLSHRQGPVHEAAGRSVQKVEPSAAEEGLPAITSAHFDPGPSKSLRVSTCSGDMCCRFTEKHTIRRQFLPCVSTTP